MRVTNNMITSNTKSNINANKVLVDKYNYPDDNAEEDQ